MAKLGLREKKKTFRGRNSGIQVYRLTGRRDTVQESVYRSGILAFLIAFTFLLTNCASKDEAVRENSAREKYTPLYVAHGPYDAALVGVFALMMSAPQGSYAIEKDQIAGRCMTTIKDKSGDVSQLCNGVEVFLYSPDGRILQRTWAYDGTFRFKVATAGPYTIKARHAEANLVGELPGVKRGQLLILELVKK